MLRTVLLCTLITAAGSTQGFAQRDLSGVAPPNNRFCLVQRETAAVNCMYATMKQCQESANVGREGECITNPGLTPSRLSPRGQR